MMSDYTEILEDMRLQDGGLVEIYVLGTKYLDWAHVIESLYRQRFTFEVVKLDTEERVDFGPQIFTSGVEVNYRLTLNLGGQVWTSNFFSTTYIDLQGDPRDITSADDIENVIRLMQCLNSATAKSVIFVAETLEPETTRPYFSIP